MMGETEPAPSRKGPASENNPESSSENAEVPAAEATQV
jgi:hypothetical protein